jgi:hypothetical protein
MLKSLFRVGSDKLNVSSNIFRPSIEKTCPRYWPEGSDEVCMENLPVLGFGYNKLSSKSLQGKLALNRNWISSLSQSSEEQSSTRSTK